MVKGGNFFMDINKHIVDQRITKIIEENPSWFYKEGDWGRKISKSFLILGVSSYLDIELSETNSLITEGGNDSGVDAIYIGDAVDFEFQVTIFQAKYKQNLENESNFPANSESSKCGRIDL